MKEKEIWKGVRFLEEDYEVSSKGRVRDKYSNEILKPFLHPFGELCVNLIDGTEKKNEMILGFVVAKAFIPDEVGKSKVGYKDGNVLNVEAANLIWVSNSEKLDNKYSTSSMFILK